MARERKKQFNWFYALFLGALALYGLYGVCFGDLSLPKHRHSMMMRHIVGSIELHAMSARIAGFGVILLACGVGLLLVGADRSSEDLFKLGLVMLVAAPIVLIASVIFF